MTPFKKPRRCLDCNKIITKYMVENCQSRCFVCNHTVMINLKTGKIWNVDSNSIGNPVLLTNGKTKMLKPSNYLVTSKYLDTFYLIADNPVKFQPNEIFEPYYDFSVPILEKALRIFKKYRKGIQ